MRSDRSRIVTAAALLALAGMMMAGCSAPAAAERGSTLIGVAAPTAASQPDLQLAYSNVGSITDLDAAGEATASQSDTDVLLPQEVLYPGAAGITVMAMDSARERSMKKNSAWGVAAVMQDLPDDWQEQEVIEPEAAEIITEDSGSAGVAEFTQPVTAMQETQPVKTVVRKTVRPTASKADPEGTDVPKVPEEPQEPEVSQELRIDQSEENGVVTDLSDATVHVAGGRNIEESDPSVQVTLGGVEVSSDYYTVTIVKDESAKSVSVIVSGDGEHFQGSAETSYTLW